MNVGVTGLALGENECQNGVLAVPNRIDFQSSKINKMYRISVSELSFNFLGIYLLCPLP